jgi:hypothetical protein
MYQGFPNFVPQAVLDKETGLVWARDANLAMTRGDDPDGKMPWTTAMTYVFNLNLGGRNGWRLPTPAELASLVDETQSNPPLPSGHPFLNVQSGGLEASVYCTSAEFNDGDSINVWGLNMDLNLMLDRPKDNLYYVWPVRGGQ